MSDEPVTLCSTCGLPIADVANAVHYARDEDQKCWHRDCIPEWLREHLAAPVNMHFGV